MRLPIPMMARKGINKYAQKIKINPTIIRKPKILIKPIPNLKNSQSRKITNNNESIIIPLISMINILLLAEYCGP